MNSHQDFAKMQSKRDGAQQKQRDDYSYIEPMSGRDISSYGKLNVVFYVVFMRLLLKNIYIPVQTLMSNFKHQIFRT